MTTQTTQTTHLHRQALYMYKNADGTTHIFSAGRGQETRHYRKVTAATMQRLSWLSYNDREYRVSYNYMADNICGETLVFSRRKYPVT